jgi:hypothetical protein
VMGAAASVSWIEYEHVTVSELQTGEPFSHDNTITITFTSDSCHSIGGN